jgi:iron complex transport system substrate-binding protein
MNRNKIAGSFPAVMAALVLASMLMVAAGCKKENGNAVAGAATALGGSAAVAAVPLRIISAAPSNTEILIGLGLADALIAVDPYSKDIPGVRQDLIEVDFFYPDIEAIIGLDPDIIVANEINNFGAADSPFKPLIELNIKIVQIPTSTSLEGIYNDIVAVAESVGVKDRGEAMAAGLRAGVNKIADTGKTITPRKKVYFEISPEPYIVTFGSGAYLNEMIEIIGAVNIFADQSGWFAPGAEAILERDPDVILCMEYPGGDDPVAEMQSREGFETVSAVRLGRIYTIDGNSASRPSQNILPALRQMAHAVYPDLYAAD